MPELVWDDRLISRERALELAGRWPVYMDIEALNEATAVNVPFTHTVMTSVHLRCARCRQSCGRFEARPSPHQGQATSSEELLAGVLRHAVMAHDLVLSGAGQGDHDG